MAAGLRVWNASGTLILDDTTSVPRLLGIVALPGNETFTDANIANGNFWYMMINSYGGPTGGAPIASLSGTTVSVVFPSGSSTSLNWYIYYGTY